MNRAYQEPVARLLTYSADIDRLRGAWPGYVEELGLTQEHVGELALMAADPTLRLEDPDSPASWAPVHAWRTLAQLAAPQAVVVLLAALEEDPDDDWALNELPRAAEMVGPPAVPVLEQFIERYAEEGAEACVAVEALNEVAIAHPEVRDVAVAIAARRLSSFRSQHPALNAFFIQCLAESGAIEHLPLIEDAFAADAVDEIVYGDVDDVRIALGAGPKPDPERRRLRRLEWLGRGGQGTGVTGAGQTTLDAKSGNGLAAAKAKARAKGKAAKQARKKNRRR